MFENLWLKSELQNKYLHVFFYSIFFSSISILITYKFLTFQQGLVSVFMISLASAYPLIRYLRKEETDEVTLIKKYTERNLLKRHSHELGIYLSFFAGVMVVFILAATFLPKGVFLIQTNTINTLVSGNATNKVFFQSILSNNLKVFGLTFLISVFFSAGMIFVLVWNASILGVFLANYSGGLHKVPLFSLGYLPHGLIEISGFILAGITGALLSYQFSHLNKEEYRRKVLPKIIRDVIVLGLIGVFMIFLAAFMEAFL